MSLKRIAELAGTSVSTVSRVLHSPGHRCNQSGLERRIWEIAREQNYIPNPAARQLRKGNEIKATPFTVDVFLTRFNSMEKDPFFLELFHFLEEELMEHQCLLGEVLNVPDFMELERRKQETGGVPYRSSENVESERIRHMTGYIEQKKNTGLMIFGKCPTELIATLRKRYKYMIGIDRNPTEYAYDEVICNGAIAAGQAMEYLISLGHTNIAYIGDCTYESRYIGYYQTLLNHKIPLRYDNVFQTGQTEQEGYRIMEDILQQAIRPSAIFCANDCTAVGVLRALREKKRKGYLPSVISIDDIEEAQRTTPMLTTIRIPKQEMVHLAVSLLLDRKNGGHQEAIRVELPCRLMERESCTCQCR